MKALHCILLAVICCFSHIDIQAQDLGRILGSIGEGLTINAVLKNPNLQSADMKNFFTFIQAGNSCYNAGKFGDAVSHYTEAKNIVYRTNDNILKKVYYNYGVKDQLQELYSNAYTQYKLQNPGQPQETFTTAAPSYGGTYSNSNTNSNSSAQTKTLCRLCGGTGLKIKEHYSAGQHKWCTICNKEVGTGHLHVTCDLCHGSGYY